MLCRTLLPDIRDEYWPYIVNEDFMLVDVHGSASALTNCGGFPGVFANDELSSKGLLLTHARALQVQAELRTKHPEEHHADCHVWAISRAVAL
jgi:hypothetical protein